MQPLDLSSKPPIREESKHRTTAKYQLLPGQDPKETKVQTQNVKIWVPEKEAEAARRIIETFHQKIKEHSKKSAKEFKKLEGRINAQLDKIERLKPGNKNELTSYSVQNRLLLAYLQGIYNKFMPYANELHQGITDHCNKIGHKEEDLEGLCEADGQITSDTYQEGDQEGAFDSVYQTEDNLDPPSDTEIDLQVLNSENPEGLYTVISPVKKVDLTSCVKDVLSTADELIKGIGDSHAHCTNRLDIHKTKVDEIQKQQVTPLTTEPILTNKRFSFRNLFQRDVV